MLSASPATAAGSIEHVCIGISKYEYNTCISNLFKIWTKEVNLQQEIVDLPILILSLL